MDRYDPYKSATDINVGTKYDELEIVRAIDRLTEWQKHVQTDSNIDRDITTAIEALKAQLGTNLAEVGTDTISRQAAIDALTKDKEALEHSINGMSGYEKEFDRFVGQRNQVDCDIYAIEQLPPAQPEIIHCKDCVKHNKDVGDLEVLPDGKRSWIWKDQACPLVSWRGKAQGHEFDYQFCACAERRTDG